MGATKSEGFSARLRELIARTGKKKADVARAAGLTPRSLSRYFSGDRVPHRAVVQALARELGVSPTWLREGDSPQAKKHALEEDHSIVSEIPAVYTFSPIALLARLDEDGRITVDRLVRALLSGDAKVRQHLIMQLEIIEQALAARRTATRKEEEA